MDLEELRTDPEFEKMIPPLTEEEYKQLETNILSEGEVLSPLVVWNGVIVDGHNRYRVLQGHPEIRYSIRQKEFLDRYEAITWICTNQLGRRNLTEIQKKMLIGKQYEAEKLMHGGKRQVERGDHGRFTASPQSDDLRSSMRTAERIAAETNTSKAYVERAGKYIKGVMAADEVLPGIEEEIMAGKLKPTAKAVDAVARASPEDRRELAELLRQPRPSPKRKKKTEPEDVLTVEEAAAYDTPDSEEEDLPDEDSPPTALAISERMASSPDRERREASVQSIIVELTDALESMMFRWDFQFSENPNNLAHTDCQLKIRELASRGIEYLKSHQGGN